MGIVIEAQAVELCANEPHVLDVITLRHPDIGEGYALHKPVLDIRDELLIFWPVGPGHDRGRQGDEPIQRLPLEYVRAFPLGGQLLQGARQLLPQGGDPLLQMLYQKGLCRIRVAVGAVTCSKTIVNGKPTADHP